MPNSTFIEIPLIRSLKDYGVLRVGVTWLRGLRQIAINAYFSSHYLISPKNPGPVFIIGTGRSGTHYLTSCLNEFEDFDDYFDGEESPYIFSEITRLTLNNKKLTPPIIGYYKKMMGKVYPSLFLDQTHPNIWHVEQLAETFPEAKFIAISRDVYSVAYSMKNHGGVSRWISEYNSYPKPNKFLGITNENRLIYETELSHLQKAVFRWCSHEKRIEYLTDMYPKTVKRIRYEALHKNMQATMGEISNFVGVTKPNRFKEFNSESLSKKDNLSDSEVEEIQSALRLYTELDSSQ